MDAINSWLGADAGGASLLWLVVAIGAAVCLFAYGVSLLVAGATNPVRRRLAEVAAPAQQGIRESRSLDLGWLVGPLARYVIPKASGERDSTQAKLIQAGFRSQHSLRNFYGIKLILALALPIIVFFAARWVPEVDSNTILFVVVLAALVGVRFPDRVLTHLRERRIKRLRNGLPDALDLLVVCVESGLGLAPAIERVARELEFSHPDLAQELALVNVEMRAGVERPVALRNLATRSGVDDINGLVALLVQTIRFGTSVAEALRVYSEEFRDKRMQKAEEQAATIGTKMIFPLVFCLFPSFFIVAVGPAALRIIAAFEQM
jgi:tight adherence protein C